MSGPIRDFLETLQERQPVRNAIRGALGMPRRYSTVIDPMEEMTLRDREMGSDISNPYPNTRPQRIASTDAAGPAAAATLPAPAQAAPIDATQPYAGMGMMQAIVTPPTAAMRQRRSMAQPQAARGGMPAQPSGLAQSIAAISASKSVSDADRAFMLADLMAQHAADPMIDNDRRATLVRIGESYMRQGATLAAMQHSSQGLQNAITTAREISSQQTKDANAGYQLDRDLPELQAKAQIMVNQAANQTNVENTAQSAKSRDYLSPLKNPALSLTDFKNQLVGAAQFAMQAGEKPNDPALAQAEGERGFDAGFSLRMGEMAKNSTDGDGLFGSHHPMFGEVATHYREILSRDPKQYDALASKLSAKVRFSFGDTLRRQGFSASGISEYADSVASDILGPKPESSTYLGTLGKLFGG